MRLNLRISMWSMATFLAATFTLCVVYGLIVQPAFHSKQFLEMVLPGFHWISFGSYCLGLAETFLYGGYTGLLFAFIHNLYAAQFLKEQKDNKITRMAA
jgi:hypothetical protein